MYLQLDEGYHEHRKTLTLCGLMQNPEADTYPVRLWRWAIRSAPSGDLTGMSAYAVETILRYRLLDGKLYDALVKAGFIDVEADGTARIHNWHKRTGASVKRLDDESAKKKRYRDHKAGRCVGQPCEFCVPERRTSEYGPRTVPGLSAGHPTDKPTQDRTGQDRTGQKSEGRDLSPPPLAGPMTAFGLLMALRVEAEERHPELGFWNPGRFAERDASDFVDRIPPEKHKAFTSELPGKVRAYFGQRDDWVRSNGWPLKGFIDRYSGLAPSAKSRARMTVAEIQASDRAERERQKREDAEIAAQAAEIKAIREGRVSP